MLYQALHTIVNKPSLQTSLFCPICCPKPFIKGSLARGLMHPADRAAKSLTGIAKRITSYMVDPRHGAARLLPYFQPNSGRFCRRFIPPSCGGAASPALETSRERLVQWSLVPSVRGSSISSLTQLYFASTSIPLHQRISRPHQVLDRLTGDLIQRDRICEMTISFAKWHGLQLHLREPVAARTQPLHGRPG